MVTGLVTTVPSFFRTTMTPGSVGPHRAFIGVASTLCVCLTLALVVGWQWFGNELKRRGIILERARMHEARVKELERLGLDAEAGIITPESLQTAPTVDLRQASPRTGDGVTVVPLPSDVKELPPQETAADFVEGVETLQKYWKATTVSERLPHVYDAARLEPLMKDYYERQKDSDPNHNELLSRKRLLIDGVEILYFSFKSSRPTGYVEVAMRRGDRGNFLVDWESLSGYGQMSFAELKKSRNADTVEIRAHVRLFEYYNYEFTDSDRYLCVKLISPNGIDTLYGYCARESEIGHWLQTQLAAGPNGMPTNGYTLKVAFPENAQSDQCVWVHQVTASRWLSLKSN